MSAACSVDSTSGTSATAPASADTVPPNTAPVLLAYFSRAGENYYYGDRTVLEVGNTETLVNMIAARIRCDVHRIEPANSYPFEYDETVERNRREQRDGVLPTLVDPVAPVGDHQVVLLASPVWNSSAPMVMHSFVRSLDLAGRTIHPITTHAVSGLSGVPDVYRELCPNSTIGEGFTAQGEEVADAGPAVDEWLRRVGSSWA